MLKRISVVILLLMSFGCTMSIGTYERGLWFDDDVRGDRQSGAGIKIDLVAGRCVRPFGGWDDPWFVLDFPCFGPFASAAFGEAGIYIGLKSFKVHEGRYSWLHSTADPNDPEIMFTPSVSTRLTRKK